MPKATSLLRCALLAAACSAGPASAQSVLRALQSCSAGAAPANGSALGGGCAPCAPGAFAPANSLACLPCRAGYYALGGASACTQCPEDHFCADPAQPPVPCASRAGASPPSPASQSYYALPGSTRCWPQCALATAQGAASMIFHAPQPCTGGFTDLPWQALWPAAPAAGTERSLFTGEAPSASAAVAGHVFVPFEALAAWYGPILALVLLAALRGLLPTCLRPLARGAVAAVCRPEANVDLEQHREEDAVPASPPCPRPACCHPAWRCTRPRRTRCEGLGTAVEIAKTLPILFLVIQPTYLSAYVCEMPRVLLTGEPNHPPAPGFAPWGHVPTGQEVPFNYQHISRAGLTDKQVMAMFALSWVAPSQPYYVAIIALELASAAFFLANAGSIFRPHFRVKAVLASALLALAWAGYEAQVFAILRLWNSEYDPADRSANLLNQSHPQVWFDAHGPEELWCNIPSGGTLVRLVALVHILLALPFLIAGTPSTSELWTSSSSSSSPHVAPAAARRQPAKAAAADAEEGGCDEGCEGEAAASAPLRPQV